MAGKRYWCFRKRVGPDFKSPKGVELASRNAQSYLARNLKEVAMLSGTSNLRKIADLDFVSFLQEQLRHVDHPVQHLHDLWRHKLRSTSSLALSRHVRG